MVDGHYFDFLRTNTSLYSGILHNNGQCQITNLANMTLSK